MDYEELLTKYMQLIAQECGSTYLSRIGSYTNNVQLSDEEKDALKEIGKESYL